MALRIEDYALIGDCETAALVGVDGSIDWLCWPRLDSDACLAALLGGPQNGRFLIAPTEAGAKVTRRYRQDTLILETRFETETGAVTLIDFMPPREKHSDVVRIVRGERGRVEMRVEFILRFGFGAVMPWVTREDDGTTHRAIAGPDMVVLRTEVQLNGEDHSTVGTFTVAAGESVPFSITYIPSHLPTDHLPDPAAALEQTERFWRDWAAKADIAGPWRDAVMRSLITLKALTYAPTGGIAAAPTTSLPETLGGNRNWDYRFCWLRDATLTLLGLMNCGYVQEATAWRDWLLRAVAGDPRQVQIMYGLAGERRLTEWEVSWLPGYEGSKPVRVGNAAHEQLQIDVFGEMLDAFYQALKAGVPRSREGWAVTKAMLGRLAEIWQQPDHGIWESRGKPKHYTYSKVMAWVAFDRAIRIAEEHELEAPTDEWRALAGQIHAEVCKHAFDKKLNSFVESYGSPYLDASALLIPTTGFLPPDDPRVLGTVAAIERHLCKDGLVLRHDPDETSQSGLSSGEGAFLACSFWLADAFALTGRQDDAAALLQRLIGLSNDVGLLAEEYDTAARRQVGNFPQAFSHIALINTVHNLTRTSKPSEQRADGERAGQDAG